MADLLLGQTCTEIYKFISGGAAHTFSFSFQPDKVVFNNLTHWTSTAGKLPISVWYRDQTTAAHAYQEQVIDSSAGASFNFIDLATNGFTVANTSGGAPAYHGVITAITQANPCVVTSAAHGLQTGQIVRITDLGSDMPTARGMNQLNNNRYKVVRLGASTFSLQDPLSGVAINSTSYTAYVTAGRWSLETRVIPVYDEPFVYDPITYKLTAGTSVMGTDGDVFNIEVYKFGSVIDLGDIG